MENVRILIGCPVCQKAPILREFNESLMNIKRYGFKIDFLFVDDNTAIESKNILKDFHQAGSSVKIVESKRNDKYICTEKSHNWNNYLIWKVAGFKNFIISYCLENDYDYLFLIDSDILLHPDTVYCLYSHKKDIISEVFWTRWMPEDTELPQVWMYDQYTLYEPEPDVSLSRGEIHLKIMEFIKKLRTPGVYRVGGLGACTLISKKAMDRGVSFERIPNISLWGEDRHFCIRAAVLGLGLYVDTHYPAYHIYRESDLEGAFQFKKKMRVCGQRQDKSLIMTAADTPA